MRKQQNSYNGFDKPVKQSREERISNFNQRRRDSLKAYGEKVEKITFEEFERARKTYERDQRRIEANVERKDSLKKIFSKNGFLDALHFIAMLGWFWALLVLFVFVWDWFLKIGGA